MMFRPKSQLRVMRWITGTGKVNSGGLRVKHAAAAHSLDSALLSIFCFLNVLFLIKNSTLLRRQNRIPCWHVIFSQNCCFVANFVDKALVDDSISDHRRELVVYTALHTMHCTVRREWLNWLGLVENLARWPIKLREMSVSDFDHCSTDRQLVAGGPHNLFQSNYLDTCI